MARGMGKYILFFAALLIDVDGGWDLARSHRSTMIVARLEVGAAAVVATTNKIGLHGMALV